MEDSILIVDDESRFRNLYYQVLEPIGLNTLQAASADEAIKLIRYFSPRMVVADVRMPGGSGIELLQKARTIHSELPFLLITAYTDVQDAVQAMKLGVVDYLAKPVDLDELVTTVREVLGLRGSGPKPNVPPEYLSGIVCESASTQSTINNAYRVARSDANVLILGESGVGIDIVARFIHNCSPRRDKALVTVIRNYPLTNRVDTHAEKRTSEPEIKTLKEYEIKYIRLALSKTKGNRTHAAEILGISRRGLIHKINGGVDLRTSSLPEWKAEADICDENAPVTDIATYNKYQNLPIFSHPTHYEGWRYIVYDKEKKSAVVLIDGGSY